MKNQSFKKWDSDLLACMTKMQTRELEMKKKTYRLKDDIYISLLKHFSRIIIRSNYIPEPSSSTLDKRIYQKYFKTEIEIKKNNDKMSS